MHMHWTCGCGYMVHADSEDDMVRRVQQHMREAHNQEVSPEEILQKAERGSH